MLAGEGLLSGLQQILHVDLNTIPTAIDTINRQFQIMIIEAEVPEEGIEEFYIGQAVSWDEESAQFDEFDALGQWESESSIIGLDEIAFIQFDTPYIKTFRKYLHGPPPMYDQ